MTRRSEGINQKKTSSQIRATVSPEQPARSLQLYRATATWGWTRRSSSLAPLSFCYRFTRRLMRTSAIQKVFYLVIFIFYVTAISTTPLLLPVAHGAPVPPRAVTHPGPRQGRPHGQWPSAGHTGAARPAEGPPAPPARSRPPHRPEEALEQAAPPPRPPHAPRQPRQALTLHHLLRPRCALRRHIAPPPTAPSGNCLRRRPSQSEPGAAAAPRPIARRWRAQEEGHRPAHCPVRTRAGCAPRPPGNCSSLQEGWEAAGTRSPSTGASSRARYPLLFASSFRLQTLGRNSYRPAEGPSTCSLPSPEQVGRAAWRGAGHRVWRRRGRGGRREPRPPGPAGCFCLLPRWRPIGSAPCHSRSTFAHWVPWGGVPPPGPARAPAVAARLRSRGRTWGRTARPVPSCPVVSRWAPLAAGVQAAPWVWERGSATLADSKLRVTFQVTSSV